MFGKLKLFTKFDPTKIHYFDLDDKRCSKYYKYLKKSCIKGHTENWCYICYDKKLDLYWLVDVWEKYSRNLAIKVDANILHSKDPKISEQIRIKFIEDDKGISTDNCQWEECQNFALNGMAFCSYHLYHKIGMK